LNFAKVHPVFDRFLPAHHHHNHHHHHHHPTTIIIMSSSVSASKLKRLAAKKEKELKKAGIDTSKKVELDVHGNVVVDESGTSDKHAAQLSKLAEQVDQWGISDRVTTGVLASVPTSKDVKLLSCS
jgi:hypothetical protein